jgi:hypothetical protein
VGSTLGFAVGLAEGTMLPTLHSIRTLPSSFNVGATLGAIVLFETLKVLLVNVMLLSSGDVVEVTNRKSLHFGYGFAAFAQCPRSHFCPLELSHAEPSPKRVQPTGQTKAWSVHQHWSTCIDGEHRSGCILIAHCAFG